jgi:hypothetical protein
MFKSQQYRAKATEYAELVKSSADAEESRKFQGLEDRFVSLADNERDLAGAYHDAVHIDEQDRTRGAALAVEEEQVLRCLGAAVIMQWNTLPTSLQREIFDTAGSVGKLLETAALRGQIARFLHKHKNESGRVKRPLTDDPAGDARSGAAALSRWDNEEAQFSTDCGRELMPTTGGFPMSLAQFSIDDGPHNMDGLRLLAQDGPEQVEAFIGRKVLDVWAESVEHRGGRQSLFRDQYNALGKLNLAALQRIASGKYQRGAASNRQHPFVEILFSDITESGEALDLTGLVREALPPAFHRLA